MDAHSIKQRFITSSFANLYRMQDYEIIPNGYIMYLAEKLDKKYDGVLTTVKVLDDGTLYVSGCGTLQVFPPAEGKTFFW
jgi:hypothetical protein